MAALTALRLEYNYINRGLLDSQPTIEYGFRMVTAQAFLTFFPPEYGKMIHGGFLEKASSSLSKKTSFFLTGFELSSCTNGPFLTWKPYELVGF